MFTDPFTKCASDENQEILNLLDHIMPDSGFRSVGLMVLKKEIGFYPSGIYYEIAQVDQHPLRTIQIIQSGKKTLICSGSVEDILSFNMTTPLSLDASNAPDYTRFYLAHVIGNHGKATLIDTVEDLMLEEEPTPALRKTLNDRIIPFALNASLAGGGYQMRGTVLIEKCLYSAFFDVTSNGQVQAQMVRVLAEILPVVNRVLEG